MVRSTGLGLLALAIAGPAAAVSVGPVTGIPRALRGDVSAEVVSCRPHAGSKHLLAARVVVRASGRNDLEVRGMECGAHNPRSGRVLFANPTDPLGRIPAGRSRSLDVVFPYDASHDQCRCRMRRVARVGAPKPPKPPPAPPRPKPSPPPEAAPRPQAVPRPAPPPPREGPRSEYVSLPAASLRGGPATASAEIVALEPGTPVTIEYEYAGWVYVHVPSRGQSGWLAADTTLPDRREAEAAAERAIEVARAEPPPSPKPAVAPPAPEPAPAPEPTRPPEPRPEPRPEAAPEPKPEPRAETAEAKPPTPAPQEPEKPRGLCETVALSEWSGMIDRIDGQKRSVYVSDLWYALPSGRKKGFVAYMNECYNLPSVRDSVTDDELASFAYTGIRIYQ